MIFPFVKIFSLERRMYVNKVLRFLKTVNEKVNLFCEIVKVTAEVQKNLVEKSAEIICHVGEIVKVSSDAIAKSHEQITKEISLIKGNIEQVREFQEKARGKVVDMQIEQMR